MATFNAGGLASGIDTNTLIDSLVKLRSLSVDALKAKQGAYTTQVSAVADIVSRLGGLDTATKALGTGGVMGVAVTGGFKGFSATASSSAATGRYTVEVTSLAAAAKQRSAGFDASSLPITAGSLDLSVNGTAVSVAVADGATLADVAAAVNQQVSSVSATVLSDGTHSYLSITNRDTGFTLGGSAANALVISGTAAAQFGFGEVTPAANAHVKVDGLDFERRNNTFSDVLTGVSMTLSQLGNGPEDLVLSSDTAATSKSLQGFVDAYNLLLKSLQKNLAVTSSTDRSTSLAGDGALKSLQRALQGLTSQVVGSGAVRTLADLGIKTGRDGSLTIDSTVLGKAISTDPAAVNAIFTTASTGISAATSTLATGYTNSVDGILTVRTKSIQGSIGRLGKDISDKTAALDRYRELLISQFTAMEKVVGQLKAAGNYLTQQSATANKG